MNFTEAFFIAINDSKKKLTSKSFPIGAHIASVHETIYWFPHYGAAGTPASPAQFNCFKDLEFSVLREYEPPGAKSAKASAWIADTLRQTEELPYSASTAKAQVADSEERWF